MKHKNTEDYYNEKSKDSKFAPSFDNLSASAKNHWEREFDKYVKAHKEVLEAWNRNHWVREVDECVKNYKEELEDDCVYQFTLCGFICYGRYVKKVNKFDMVCPNGYTMIAVNECTDIVKLVPEVK